MKPHLSNMGALLLGASLTLAYAPFAQWWITPLAITAFIYLLSSSNKGWLTGFCFGLGWFGAGISWVHVSIAEFGGLPLLGSVGLMALLVGYLSIYPALFSWAAKKTFPLHLWPLALPLLWLVAEWLRGWMLSGFPWLSLGYSQISGPLAGWLPIIGETGVSALLLLVCTVAALRLPQKAFSAPAVLAVVLIVGGWTLNKVQWVELAADPVKISMVQGNIRQELRWVPELEQPTMDKYLGLTEPLLGDSDIVIWPEAAIPRLEPLAVDFIQKLDAQAREANTGLITGIVNYNFETRAAHNSLLALGQKRSDGRNSPYYYPNNDRYSKHHLLPVGEFIPLEDFLRGLAPIFDLPMSSFSRGDYQQQNLVAKDQHLAPAICFEIVFPQQIRANLRQHTDFIITVSNDAWFGNSHGPDQHLEIAQVRAKEFGIPVLRATNNGITAFIDHHGKIQSRLPQFEEGVLTDNLYKTNGQTPYGRFGDWPIWLLSLLAFGWALYCTRKQAAHV